MIFSIRTITELGMIFKQTTYVKIIAPCLWLALLLNSVNVHAHSVYQELWKTLTLFNSGTLKKTNLNTYNFTGPYLVNDPFVSAEGNCMAPFEAPVFADDNDDNLSISLDSVVTMLTCGYSVQRTWTATNFDGESTSFVQTAFFEDSEPPTINIDHPDFLNAQNGDTLTFNCNDVPALELSDIDVFDECGASHVLHFEVETINYDCATSGYFQLKECVVEVADDCGNTNSLKIFFKIADTEAPVLQGLPPSILFADCSTIPPAINIMAMDNCDGETMAEFTENIQYISCPFTIVRNWFAFDACGNMANYTQTVILSDFNPPEVVGPLDVTMNGSELPIVDESPFFDSCDDDLTESYTDTYDTIGCEQIVTRIWQSTDDCGNSNVATQLIHIFDDLPPTIEFVNPQLEGLADGDTLILDCNDQPYFDANDAIAIDSWSMASISFSENGADFGDCHNEGFFVLLHCTWMATDICGNETSITIHMKMEDHTPPVFTDVPADVTIPCGGNVPSCQAPALGDFCGNAYLTSTVEEQSNDEGYERICYWTATDECGNEVTASQTITVFAGGFPEMNGVPPDLTVLLANNEIVPPPANVTAFDDCTNDSISIVFEETITTSMDGCEEIIHRTWSATDSQNNSIEESQTITVINELETVNVSSIPDTCAMELGSVVLLPDDYNYTWSDGYLGSMRDGILTGTYSVIASNNGCDKNITVQVGNILQMPPPNIATLPETCGAQNGAISLTPLTYSYSWNDGAIGASRNNLSEGIYTVTVSNGTCNAILDITIEDVCDCELAVLASLDTISPDCGMFNGAATLNLVGEESDYVYTWVPDIGAPVASGNGRTGLSAQRYVVFATFMGDPTCVEKFEFDLMDNCFRCPQEEENALIIDTHEDVTNSCLPIPYGTATTKDIFINGQLKTAPFHPCIEQNVFGYEYDGLPNTSEQDMFVVQWDDGTAMFQTMVHNMDELAAIMHYRNPAGKWQNDPLNQRLLHTGELSNYGTLNIKNLTTDSEYHFQINAFKAHLGTALPMEIGNNQIEILNPATDCKTTMNVTINKMNVLEEGVLFTLFPNPANQQVAIGLRPAFGSSVAIRIFDYIGNVKKNIQVEKVDKMTQLIDLSGFMEGYYFVKVQTPGLRPCVLKLVIGKL